MTGLQFEQKVGQNSESLRIQTELFMRFKRGKLNPREKINWIQGCLTSPEKNIFCEFSPDKHAVKAKDLAPENASGLSMREVFSLVNAFKKLATNQGNLLNFRDVKENALIKAFKNYDTYAPLEPLVDRSLKSKVCPPSSLLTALGMKMEEFFPEPKFQDLATQLFAKSAECGTDESAVKARFRLSLHLIAHNQCAQAESYLAKMTQDNLDDYSSRVFYWRAQCAQKLGNLALYTRLKERLLRDYPLSYHGLLIRRQTIQSVILPEEMQGPLVRFRTKHSEYLNAYVRAIEMMQAQKANDLAEPLLDRLIASSDEMEPQFRLYLAILISRGRDNIRLFKLLSVVFKDQPELISRSTLELFYPLRRFDIIRRYGSKVDPYLISALIRQESAFNDRARSPAGAIGLMQLMPRTARLLNRSRVTGRELLDAKTNVRLGVKYFYRLLERFNGDAELALAAYNAGPERVDQWRRRYEVADRMLFIDLIPYKETRDYVASIARNYFWYLSLYSKEALEAVKHVPKPDLNKKRMVTFSVFSS